MAIIGVQRSQWEELRSTTGPARRALVSAWCGFFVDMVDIYLPVVALAPALAYFQPSSMSSVQAASLFYVTFAATLVGRPLGALVFGHLADTLGRRRLTLVAIGGFSVCTILIGSLPGYSQVGVLALVLLIGLRFVNGIFLAGEYTAATPLAFEHCPAAARGLYGGLLLGAYALAYAAISAVVLVLLAVLSVEDYVAWGWRIPFLTGGLLGLVFLAYRSRVPESDAWRAARKEPRPLRTIAFGRFRRDLAQVFLLMVGLWFVSSSVVSIMPRMLAAELGRAATWVTSLLLVSQLFVFAAFAGVGMLSQAFGRRRTLIVGAATAGTGGAACYGLLLTGRYGPGATAVLAIATQVLVLAVWGAVISYSNERFETPVRASGFGVSYSLSVLPASFFAGYMVLLSGVMPYRYTPLVLLGFGAALTAVSAWAGPETNPSVSGQDRGATV